MEDGRLGSWHWYKMPCSNSHTSTVGVGESLPPKLTPLTVMVLPVTQPTVYLVVSDPSHPGKLVNAGSLSPLYIWAYTRLEKGGGSRRLGHALTASSRRGSIRGIEGREDGGEVEEERRVTGPQS